MESRCLEGYLDGLRDAGWDGVALDVRLAYLASLVLRCGLGATGPIVTVMLDQSLHIWLEQAFRHPLDAIVRNLRSTMRFLEPRVLEARQLLTRYG